MNEETDTMTHDRRDQPSIQDLTYTLAQDRIADLRASATSTDPVRHAGPAASPGFVARSRDALGRRLIELGGSVVADDTLRQRALHR